MTEMTTSNKIHNIPKFSNALIFTICPKGKDTSSYNSESDATLQKFGVGEVSSAHQSCVYLIKKYCKN